MLKTLLKKQFLEASAFFFLTRDKDGKSRKTITLIGLFLLIAYALFASVILFWELAGMICQPYHAAGLDWVYFAFMGTTAAAIGCVGTAFAAKNRLYEAKDNELLLAMPIPPWMILCTRVLSLYLFTLLFTSVAFVPACVRYFIVAGISFGSAVCCFIITLVLPLGVLALACLLGWVIALLTARSTKKNLLTTVLLLAFLIGYSMLSSRLQTLLNYAAENGVQIGAHIQTTLYPFWQMGLGATGNWLETLIFTAIFATAFALVYVLLNTTFLYIITERKTGKRIKYREKQSKTSPIIWSLIKKETARYTTNPMILFNCGLGSILCLLFIVFIIFDPSIVADISAAPVSKLDVAMIATTIMLFIVSSTMITASCVSLEGDNLWLLRSMPISTETIFLAKAGFHVLYAALPAALTLSVFFAMVQMPFVHALLSVLTTLAASVLFAVMGLAINLKLPKLKWTSEVVVVKQSVAPLIAMFGGWGICALCLGGNFLFGQSIGIWYFIVMTAVLALASVGVCLWLKKRGKEIFETL